MLYNLSAVLMRSDQHSLFLSRPHALDLHSTLGLPDEDVRRLSSGHLAPAPVARPPELFAVPLALAHGAIPAAPPTLLSPPPRPSSAASVTSPLDASNMEGCRTPSFADQQQQQGQEGVWKWPYASHQLPQVLPAQQQQQQQQHDSLLEPTATYIAQLP